MRVEIDAIVGPPGPSRSANPLRLGLADHFWCDLFAAIAQVAQEAKAQLDQVPDDLARVVVEHCMRPLFGEEIKEPAVARIRTALYEDLFSPVPS